MEIYYPNKHLYKNNIFLTLKETTDHPIINLTNANLTKIYTLVMFDPDAVGGNKIHWLITNITKNNILGGDELIQYKGPAPPKNSGIHRYVFCLLEQKKIIPVNDISFNSRFIELVDLFRKLHLKLDFFDVKYFVSENLDQ